jgi:hypothetical protein
VSGFRFLRLGVPALAFLLTLSACGGRFVPPAAVVNGQRVSQDELQTELAVVLTNPANADQAKTVSGRSDVVRRVLVSLIELDVVQQYASTHHVAVTATDVGREEQQFIDQLGGQAQFEAQIRRQHLTAAQVRQIFARDVLFTKVQDEVVSASGSNSTDPTERNRIFGNWLRGQFQAADIRVNPRFGRLDPRTVTIRPITSTAA